jgi:hypothetical protein
MWPCCDHCSPWCSGRHLECCPCQEQGEPARGIIIALLFMAIVAFGALLFWAMTGRGH